jgi:drug/metabolite transporter (DMT)-like permease
LDEPFIPGRNAPRKWVLVGSVSLAVLAISFAAILIRLAEAPPLAISFWRNAFGTLFLLPFLVRQNSNFPTGRSRVGAIVAGLALSVHFGFWITSLEFTSVASSVVLVCTQPIFVTLLAWFFLRERISRTAFAGIIVAIIGTFLIGSDYQFGPEAFMGNMLALAGAVAIAVYVLIGRWIRSDGTGLVPYTILVYGSAALSLLIVCLLMKIQLFGFSWATWLCLFLITLGPQLMGHTVFNWALRYVKAPILSGTILLEPVLSTALAWAILHEVPPAASIGGGFIILLGLGLVLRGR